MWISCIPNFANLLGLTSGLLSFSIWLIYQSNGTDLALFLAIGGSTTDPGLPGSTTSESDAPILPRPRGGGVWISCIPNFGGMAACTAH